MKRKAEIVKEGSLLLSKNHMLYGNKRHRKSLDLCKVNIIDGKCRNKRI